MLHTQIIVKEVDALTDCQTLTGRNLIDMQKAQAPTVKQQQQQQLNTQTRWRLR